MTSDKIKKLEDAVRPILEESIEARSDDFFLYGKVVELLCPECKDIPLNEALRSRRYYGLPNYESVTRVRRRLQAKYPELSSEPTRRVRYKESGEYKKYAIGE